MTLPDGPPDGAMGVSAAETAEVQVPAEVLRDELTTGDWVTAGLVLVGSLVAAVAARRLLVRALAHGDAERGVAALAGRFAGYVVVLAGAVYALASLEVRIGPLLGALGIGGIALAFALQEILSNLVAGILLQVRRPFHRGDEIRSGDFEGVVRDIDLRVVRLRTYDGLEVFLPNAQVLGAPIVNITRKPNRRTALRVGVAYSSDLRQAQEVLVAAVAGAEQVLPHPAPEAWVEEFADSSIVFTVRFWHRSDIATTVRARSAASIAIKEGLDAAGVAIPFPQRTLWFGPGSSDLRLVREDGDEGDAAGSP